jgi:hypothetical protein
VSADEGELCSVAWCAGREREVKGSAAPDLHAGEAQSGVRAGLKA